MARGATTNFSSDRAAIVIVSRADSRCTCGRATTSASCVNGTMSSPAIGGWKQAKNLPDRWMDAITFRLMRRPRRVKHQEGKGGTLDRERRKQILDAAFQCFVQFGYSKTSMEDVARKSNLSRPLIYSETESTAAEKKSARRGGFARHFRFYLIRNLVSL